MLKKFFKVKVVAMILALLLVFGVAMVSAGAFTGVSNRISKVKTENEMETTIEVKPFTYSLQVDSLGNCNIWNWVYMNGKYHLVDSDSFLGTRFIVTGDTFFVQEQNIDDALLDVSAEYENPVVFFQFEDFYDDEIGDSEIYVNGKKIEYGDFSRLDLGGERGTYLYVVAEPLEE